MHTSHVIYFKSFLPRFMRTTQLLSTFAEGLPTATYKNYLQGPSL
jgi:hypothetical protein